MNARPEEIRAHSLTEILPWMMVGDPGARTVVCKDDSILGAWAMHGIDVESAEENQLEHAALQVDAVYRRIADAQASVWAIFDRSFSEGYIRGHFDHPVARFIDDNWAGTFEGNPLYRNRLFMAASMPTRGRALSIGESIGENIGRQMSPPMAVVKAFRDRLNGSRAFGFTDRQALDAAVKRFENVIAAPFQNALTHVKTTRLRGPDLLGFLKWTASANPLAPVAVDEDAYLDSQLSDTSIDNSYADHLVLDGRKRRYASVLTLKSAPRGGMLQSLNVITALPVELRIAMCWRSVTPAEADKVMAGARAFDEMRGLTPRKLFKKMMSSAQGGPMDDNDEPTTPVGVVAQSFREMIRRRQAFFGWMANAVTVFGDSPRELEAAMELVVRELEKTGYVFLRERDGSLSGFCTGIPGQLRQVVRWHLVEAGNATDATPLISLDSGSPRHSYFSELLNEECPPTATFRSRWGTVQYFNNHVGQLGHTLLIGPSRNGKTLLQMFLESQFLKYRNAKIFNLDKDLSCKPATLMLGGQHVDLDPNRGGGLKLNPMLYAREQSGRLWLLGWIDRLMRARGDKLDDRDMEEVYKGLELAAEDTDRPRLSTLLTQLPERLRVRLAPWCADGAYGMYFDHVEDQLSMDGQIQTTEIGSLIAAGLNDVVGAYTDYLFYRVERYLMDRPSSEIGPTQVYFEEAGFLLDDPIFADKARDYLMTLAKKGAFLTMTAQSPEPFAVNEKLGAAVRDNVATVIFMPNAGARRPDLGEKYRKAFGLNTEQLEIIADATPKREYCVYQPQTGFFRVIQANFPTSVVSCLRSDVISQGVLNKYYYPEDPDWRSKYLDALEALERGQ
jgi:type IV secretion system protein VirB4